MGNEKPYSHKHLGSRQSERRDMMLLHYQLPIANYQFPVSAPAWGFDAEAVTLTQLEVNLAGERLLASVANQRIASAGARPAAARPVWRPSAPL
jgi:hypothetical protein